MIKSITSKLLEIESSNRIKILFANESGSRAWGFPSPDSDYDVRFIYSRTEDSYLSIDEQNDSLSLPINDELDIYGWDIKKTLKLISKSNTTPFEWLQSPIVYQEQEGFKNELWAICHHYFSQRANIFHYLGIAKSAIGTIEKSNEIKIKKLFYILRPLLSAKWCLEKNNIAPMNIQPLLEVAHVEVQKCIQELILQKEKANEGFVIQIPSMLINFINQSFEDIMFKAQSLKKDNFKLEELNQFFRKTITNHDY